MRPARKLVPDPVGEGLVGRVRELELLVASLEHVTRGRGQVVLVEGEAGIGKTALLQEALETARQRCVRVFSATAEELEARRPFGAIADCLGIAPAAPDPRRAAIARLLLGEGDEPVGWEPWLTGPQVEFRVVEAMIALVEDLATSSPLVIAIDDLQWADVSTLLVVHRLGRIVDRLPLLLWCTIRPVPRGPELHGLITSLVARGAQRMTVGPLHDDSVAGLVEALIGAPPGPALLRQAAGAAGNPLFVKELVGALTDARAFRMTEAGRAEVDAVGLPPSVGMTILHRLSFLPDPGHDVLRVAAILGSSFSVTDLSLLTGRPTFDLLAALRESLAAGTLIEEPARLRFRHDMVREALYHDLPAAVRSGLHRDAARALASAGAPAEQVGEHFMRAGPAAGAEAVEWLRRAARSVAPRAPSVAVELLKRALEVADPADPERTTVVADQAVSLMWSGRAAEVERLCRHALADAAGAATEGSLRLCLAQALFARGLGEAALAELQVAAGLSLLSEVDRIRARAWESTVRISVGDLGGAVQLAEQAAQDAGHVDDALAGCIATTTLATAQEFRGDFNGAIERAEDAARLADRSPGQVAHRFHANFFLGMFLADADRFDEAQRALARGRRVSERLGAKWNLPMYLWATAFVRFAAGAWDDAIAECGACVEFADETGTRHGLMLSHSFGSIIALHRNDLTVAEAAMSAAVEELDRAGRQHGLQCWVSLAQALFWEATGRTDAAADLLFGTWEQAVAAQIASYDADVGVDLVRLLLSSGDDGRATRVSDAVRRLAARNPRVPRLTGTALHCEGLIAGDPELLVKAVEAHRRGPRPLERARVCEDAAVALVGAGRPSEASPLFDEALAGYERLRAARDVARLEARLRAGGRPRGRRGPRGRPKTGWESLTETERRVADLVATGLSNPQIADRLFISRHTVHTHLSHILAKLGLRSRVELAAAVARGSIPPSGFQHVGEDT